MTTTSILFNLLEGSDDQRLMVVLGMMQILPEEFEMSDTIELAKQCGCDVVGEPDRRVTVSLNGHIVFVEGNLQAFRAACVKEATEELHKQLIDSDAALRESRANDLESMRQANDLRAKLAMQDEALRAVDNSFSFDDEAQYSALEKVGKAISATASEVASWEQQKLAAAKQAGRDELRGETFAL